MSMQEHNSAQRAHVTVSDRAEQEYIYLYFPFLPVLRLARTRQLDIDQPIALYESCKGVDRLVFLSAHACAAGLETGLSVPDAKARLPQLLCYPADKDKDREMLHHLARWAWRYSPRTGVDSDGLGIWIDMTGASHLRGGVQSALADMLHRLQQAELVVRGAAATDYAAAWALAHFHADADTAISCFGGYAERSQMLDQLDIQALRLEPDSVSGLIRSGLRQTGDIRHIGRRDLAMRFGMDVIMRLEQLYQGRAEKLIPIRSLPPVHVSITAAEPICGSEPVAQMVQSLITDMAAMLMQQEKQARRFEIGWQRSDGSVGMLHFQLSRPSNDIQIISRLCRDAPQHIQAEFGLDYGWMKAEGLVDDRPVTAMLGTDPDALAEIELDYLIDALAARLGPDKVQRAIPEPSWQIEKAEQRVAFAAADNKHHDWEVMPAQTLKAPRPVRLLSPAEAVQTISVLPDHPPHLLKWRKKHWKVIQATGPERIGPAWWDHTAQNSLSRDYYRLQLEEGPRIWVYREGLAERGDPLRWYMQGFFA